MAASSTLETIQRADLAGALGFGAAAVLAPRLVQRVYGVRDPSPQAVLMTRLWGGVLGGMGAHVLTSPGGMDRRTLQTLAAMNAVNAASSALTPGLLARTRVMATLTSAAFAAASAYGAAQQG